MPDWNRNEQRRRSRVNRPGYGKINPLYEELPTGRAVDRRYQMYQTEPGSARHRARDFEAWERRAPQPAELPMRRRDRAPAPRGRAGRMAEYAVWRGGEHFQEEDEVRRRWQLRRAQLARENDRALRQRLERARQADLSPRERREMDLRVRREQQQYREQQRRYAAQDREYEQIHGWRGTADPEGAGRFQDARQGPYRTGYQGQFGADTPPHYRDRYRRPWQGGMEENRFVERRPVRPLERGGWEEEIRVREYHRAIPNLPGFNPGERRTDDEDIRGDIYELLSDNPHIFAPDVNVSVKDGQVRLEGVVRSQREKDMATEIAQMVRGVRQIDNRLDTII